MTPIGTSPLQQRIAAAWQNQKGRVEADLPNLTTSLIVADIFQNAELNICYQLNSPEATSAAPSWDDDGDGTIALFSLKVTELSGVAQQQAIFPMFSGDGVYFPVNFALLIVNGKYCFSQPCACYDIGIKVGSSEYAGQGEVANTVSNGQIWYKAHINAGAGPVLVLDGVEVTGSQEIKCKDDASGGFLDFLSPLFGEPTQSAVLANIASVLSSSQFLNGLMIDMNNELTSSSSATA